MGSIDGYEKGKHPVLLQFQAGVDRYNEAVHRRACAAPFRLKLLAFLGYSHPYERWQMNTPIYNFYPMKKAE